MSIFHIIAGIIALASACTYLNYRFVKLPASIGQMVFALVISATVLLLEAAGLVNLRPATSFIHKIDFSNILLHGMLSFMLFAGALHIDLKELKGVVWPVSILATLGVAIATAITGTLVWYAAGFLGLALPYIWALVFGALISPTDPIAVLAILKEVGLSRSLYVKIGSESLLNDGVAIVVFTTLLAIAVASSQPTVADAGVLLLRQGAGGALLGLLLGVAAYRLLKPVDEYRVEIILTVGIVSGGYALAELLQVSAPLCMVVTGLVIGNSGRKFAMSELSRRRLDDFWELVDEILNAVLFMLIGLEIVVISFSGKHVILGVFAILAVLVGRFLSVGSIIGVLRPFQSFEKGTIRLLTWGGLRGGLSIAMALSLPYGAEKSTLLPITYIVVLFSIMVQGLTFKPVLKVLFPKRSLETTS